MSACQVCTCIEGYEGDPVAGCTKIDVCDPFPCGEKAECGEKVIMTKASYGKPAYKRFEPVIIMFELYTLL